MQKLGRAQKVERAGGGKGSPQFSRGQQAKNASNLQKSLPERLQRKLRERRLPVSSLENFEGVIVEVLL